MAAGNEESEENDRNLNENSKNSNKWRKCSGKMKITSDVVVIKELKSVW